MNNQNLLSWGILISIALWHAIQETFRLLHQRTTSMVWEIVPQTLFTSDTNMERNFEEFVHFNISLFIFSVFNNSVNSSVYIASINIGYF